MGTAVIVEVGHRRGNLDLGARVQVAAGHPGNGQVPGERSEGEARRGVLGGGVQREVGRIERPDAVAGQIVVQLAGDNRSGMALPQ